MSSFWLGFIISPFALAFVALLGTVAVSTARPPRYPAWSFGHETVYGPVGAQGECLHSHIYRERRWWHYRLAAAHARRSMTRCHAERLRGIDNYAKYDFDYVAPTAA